MGIQGLLPQLRSITTKAHVSKYRGQRAAVDAYVLLHRGAYTCAREICEGESTERCTEYCMSRIQMLLGAGVIPVVVFDGGRLPNKDEEERNRARSREENKAKARALWQQGNKTAAFECYQRAVDIDPLVAKGFIDALKARGVEYIVAPYEADAQMAYLALNGQVQVVITEDSDLLTYGCPRVFFKMDKSGEGEEIELKNLVHTRELSFIGFTHDMFQEMCILAGCDFVKALPGIGIKKAHQQIRQRKSFVKVIKNLRFSGTPVPPDYERRVQRAVWTFKHQRVYCPQRRAVVHLHEVEGGSLEHGALVPSAAQLVGEEEDFLGPPLHDDVAQAIAAGNLDPITKRAYAASEEQPCTAPQQQDDPTHATGSQGSDGRSALVQDSLRQIMEGLDGVASQGQQQRQQRPKGRSSAAPVAANGGNTLAKYGFLRASGSARKEFRKPRLAGEAAPSEAQQQQQQEQQQQTEALVPPNFSQPRAERAAERQVPAASQQAFLEELQAAEQRQPQPVAWSQAEQPIQPAPAAAPASRGGISGLMAKLRADLQEPRLDGLLRPHGRDGGGAAATAERGGAAGMPQAGAPLDLGLPSSPTVADLLGSGAGASPGSPLLGGLGPVPAGQQPVQQITPSFYGVPDSEEQPDCGLLPGELLLATAGASLEEQGALHEERGEATAAADAISSVEHVHAFARVAKAAVDRATAQAVRESSAAGLPHVQPPAYLQRRQLQQQSSAATLKRPFAVPRKAGSSGKENGLALPGGKRSKQGGPQENIFSKFICK